MKVVVIGAGIGGLATAAVLARAGFAVTVLENHIYPGGCAGTFYHRDYHFDAGATLAGGYDPGGPMEKLARAIGVRQWGGKREPLTMEVHLPDGPSIKRWGDDQRWQEREDHFGTDALAFWHWQEQTADHLWRLAVACLPWPPQSTKEAIELVRAARSLIRDDVGTLGLMRDISSKVTARLPRANARLRDFVDAQLLIASQTDANRTNALYGAAALDLPRREVRQFEGGIGTLAKTFAGAVEANGGTVLYRQRASRIRFERGRPIAVETSRKGKTGEFDADVVVANITPRSLRELLEKRYPKLERLCARRTTEYGAFTVYAGVRDGGLPPEPPVHHQVLAGGDFREGRSVFVSISPAWDPGRAPAGRRAVTMSTHTRLAPWWQLFHEDREAYEERKLTYLNRMVDTVSRVFPGFSAAIEMALPGTPVTFQRFTSRSHGWVGGFPQKSAIRVVGPRLGAHLWMVGDTIFPGQSTAAVAMGGLRVARSIRDDLGSENSTEMHDSEG